MKDMKNSKKIALGLFILIIISGIICLSILGFNKGLELSSYTRVEVYIPNGYEKEDIEAIANESFNNKIEFVEVEKLNQVAGIKIKSYTEEELKTYKDKIMEKYNIAEDKLEVYEIAVPETRISTVVKPYVFPVTLVTVLAFIYLVIRNIKSKKLFKIIAKDIIIMLLIAGIYFSLIALIRIPFNSLIMPIALMIYIITLLLIIKKED